MRYVTRYPILYLCTNTHTAVWYYIEEGSIQKITELHEPQSTYSDNEGFFRTSGRGGTTVRAGAPSHDNWTWQEEAKHHFKSVAEQTAALWREHEYRHMVVTVPVTEKNIVSRYFHDHLPNISIMYTYGNVVHKDEQDLYTLATKILQQQVPQYRVS